MFVHNRQVHPNSVQCHECCWERCNGTKFISVAHMEKRVVVETSSAEKTYKLVVSGSTYKYYYYHGGLFDSWTEIGKRSGWVD